MPVFPQTLTPAELEIRNWNSVTATDPLLGTSGYSAAFREQAKLLSEQGDALGHDALRALEAVLSLRLTPNDRALPFRPMMIWGDKRSLAIEDLEEADIRLLADLGPGAASPIVRAHLCDIAWVAGRAHGITVWMLGPIAARAYLEVFQQAHREEKDGRAFDELLRGLQLAWEFRKQAPEVLTAYWSCLEQAAREAVASNSLALLGRLLSLFADRRHPKCAEMADVAQTAADAANVQDHSLPLADLWDAISDLRVAANQPDKARQATVKRGETLIAWGEIDSARSAMSAVHWLQQGLECLRRGRADQNRVEEVHRRLLELGETSLSEMGQIGTELDGKDAIEAAERTVSELPLLDALLHFAFGQPLLSPKELRETVEKQAREFPLQHLIESRMVDSEGKTTAVRPSLPGLQGQAYEDALLQSVFDHAHRFDLPLRVQLYIRPAANQIWNEHHPGFVELAVLVKDNPFIPQGHEDAYLRGFVAGFMNDWVIAAHLLIPKVEASVRYVLKGRGAITSNVQPDGTQEEKKLHQLLAMPEAQALFGEDILFELRLLLVEALGANLRNEFAHGRLTDNGCYGADVRSLWWLLMRICLTPLALRMQRDAKAEAAASAATENDGAKTS